MSENNINSGLEAYFLEYKYKKSWGWDEEDIEYIEAEYKDGFKKGFKASSNNKPLIYEYQNRYYIDGYNDGQEFFLNIEENL